LHWLEASAQQGDGMSLMVLGGLYSGEIPNVSIPRDAAKSYAYMMLFLKGAGDETAEAKTTTERELRAKMSAEEISRAEAIIAGWHAQPTALTEKAYSGQAAAEHLVATAR
jgi:hypothetical protein